MNPSINIALPNTPETSLPDAPALSGPAGTEGLVVTRIAERHWHALEDDRVVGRGEVLPRPDGRNFVSIDAWHSDIFARLAQAMLADLPRPLYTVTDEADDDLTAQWQWAGFTVRRREYEYLLPTDPSLTGLDDVEAPSGVKVLGLGRADPGPLRELDRRLRRQLGTADDRSGPPAGLLRLSGSPADAPHPSDHAVAAQGDRYVGLLRLAPSLRLAPRRRPRIALIGVRTDQRRRGIARAMLTEVLGNLHRLGHRTVSVEVDEADTASSALFENLDARRGSSTLELVIR